MDIVFPYILEILYLVILITVSLRVIIDTSDSAKTLAYLLLIIFVPFVGMIIYFIFGTNYRKRQLYSKKLTQDQDLLEEVENRVKYYSQKNLKKYKELLRGSETCVQYLLNDTLSPLTAGNELKLLFNGEEKFEELIQELKRARHHIHIEYYIINEGELLQQITEILKQKATEGVKVRIIYDDFGSRKLSKKLLKEWEKAGIEAFPFHKVWFNLLANRLNYRNHRKIIVIDGEVGFTGGINLSDKYSNKLNGKKYWRDTHLLIRGPGIFKLQFLFFTSWRFCTYEELPVNRSYFPLDIEKKEDSLVQIASGGPDSPRSTILLTIMDAVSVAKDRLYITSPYFLPDDSLMKIIEFEALAGLDVRIIVPGKPDSLLVNAAAFSYYARLMESGVRIFLYEKGMIHAKTIVADDSLAIIGTANMDQRSFDLNFEVNAMVYNSAINSELTQHFMHDLEFCREITLKDWENRPKYKKYGEAVARLVSPLL